MSPLELHTVAILDFGCFSVLKWLGVPFAVSVERTFENLRVVIPGGVSRCRRSFYHKGGYPTYEILVPGHDRVLFHRGNLEEHSLACVVIGESFGELFSRVAGKLAPAVLDSKGGFTEFMAKVGAMEEFDMLVTGR